MTTTKFDYLVGNLYALPHASQANWQNTQLNSKLNYALHMLRVSEGGKEREGGREREGDGACCVRLAVSPA